MDKIIEVKKTTKEEIHKTIKEYYRHIIAPMDDMWEKAIIGASNYYRVLFENKDAGYFCLDNGNVLLQYFIKDEFADKTKVIFEYILEEYSIKKGFISTIDIRNLPLFLDFNREICTHTLLYKDIYYVDRIKPIENVEVKVATSNDLQKIIEYHENSVDIKREWLEPYCIDMIKKQQLFLFISNNEIIGTGEIRLSENQIKYANLGVTVSKKYRRKGLASYILSYIKKDCYKNELVPICSTTIKNIGSQKAMESSVFFAYHRILEVKFKFGEF